MVMLSDEDPQVTLDLVTKARFNGLQVIKTQDQPDTQALISQEPIDKISLWNTEISSGEVIVWLACVAQRWQKSSELHHLASAELG